MTDIQKAAAIRRHKQTELSFAYNDKQAPLVNITPAAFLPSHVDVPDCAFIEEDIEILEQAQRGIVYAHRLDHAPSCFFLEQYELEVCVALGLKSSAPFTESQTASAAQARLWEEKRAA